MNLDHYKKRVSEEDAAAFLKVAQAPFGRTETVEEMRAWVRGHRHSVGFSKPDIMQALTLHQIISLWKFLMAAKAEHPGPFGAAITIQENRLQVEFDVRVVYPISPWNELVKRKGVGALAAHYIKFPEKVVILFTFLRSRKTRQAVIQHDIVLGPAGASFSVTSHSSLYEMSRPSPGHDYPQ